VAEGVEVGPGVGVHIDVGLGEGASARVETVAGATVGADGPDRDRVGARVDRAVGTDREEVGEPARLPALGAAFDAKRALPNPTPRTSSAMATRAATTRGGTLAYQPPYRSSFQGSPRIW
jgi:hypothetical protein